MKITEEAKQRMITLLGTDEWFHKSIEFIPQNHNGLGYKWYPIVVHTDLDTKDLYTLIIHPCINVVRGCDTEKTVVYSEDEVMKSVASNILQMGHPDFYSGLGIYKTFLDPKEISDAIEYFKGTGKFHGFMPAFDTIKFEIDGETNYLNQQNCLGGEQQLKTDNYKLNFSLKFVEEKNSRVFNAVMDITICKRKKPVTPFEKLRKKYYSLCFKLLDLQIENNCMPASIKRPSKDEDPIEFYQTEQKRLLKELAMFEKQ